MSQCAGSSRFIVPVRAGLIAFLAFSLVESLALGQSIGLNFDGINRFEGALLTGNNGYAPPDNAGAVGQSHIVQLINGAFAVYDKSNGDPLYATSGRQFWIDAGVDPGDGISGLGAFNQRILYDPNENRWIAAALTADSVDNRVMLARSETSNPLGPWQAVSFLGNAGGTGRFVDYTALGIDANGVYVTTNNFTSIVGSLDSVSVFSVPKADLLAPVPTLANMTRFDDLNSGAQPLIGWTLQPIVNHGTVGTHAPLLATDLVLNDTYLYRSDLMNTSTAGATMTIESTPILVDQFTLPPLAAQPDGTRSIHLQDTRFKSHVMQVGDAIYGVHDVRVDGNAAIRWYKIDETTSEVIDSGTISDPNYDFYQASIAANPNGDVVIGFNRSGFGPDGQISIYAALGTTLGDLTTFGDPFVLLAGTVDDYHYLNSRWGDYTTTVVDPFNPNVFWTFQEYPLANNAWATRITQILVPEPASCLLATSGALAFLFVARRARRRRAIQ